MLNESCLELLESFENVIRVNVFFFFFFLIACRRKESCACHSSDTLTYFSVDCFSLAQQSTKLHSEIVCFSFICPFECVTMAQASLMAISDVCGIVCDANK